MHIVWAFVWLIKTPVIYSNELLNKLQELYSLQKRKKFLYLSKQIIFSTIPFEFQLRFNGRSHHAISAEITF